MSSTKIKNTIKDPLIKLNDWWNDAKHESPLKQKSAVCLSTINAMGFPNSRFVDLKNVESGGITFCSSFDSEKGDDIKANPRVGIAVWWDHVGYQVRIIGLAVKVDENKAKEYWESRKRGAQVATASFNQSKEIDNQHLLIEKTKAVESLFEGKIIPKPGNWGGYRVKSISIEFLQFRENRIHIREFYQFTNDVWSKQILQP